MSFKDYLEKIGTQVLALGIIFGGMRACNSAWNDKTIDNPGYNTKSHATGIVGHTEFTTYTNGSHDVKTYPGFIEHRYFNSQLSQDLDGDGVVDRIRQDGSEFRMHSLKRILTREQDYNTHKKLFDKADKQLYDLILKDSTKK